MPIPPKTTSVVRRNGPDIILNLQSQDMNATVAMTLAEAEKLRDNLTLKLKLVRGR